MQQATCVGTSDSRVPCTLRAHSVCDFSPVSSSSLEEMEKMITGG